MAGLTRDAGTSAEGDGEDGEEETGPDEGSDGEANHPASRTRFWRATVRLGFSLGLSPKELWKEYTYNDLLVTLYFYRQKQERVIQELKLAAYYNLVAMSHLMGEGKKTFDDVFPAPKPIIRMTTEELKEELAKHKMVLVE